MTGGQSADRGRGMQSIHPGRSGPLATASTGVHAWLSILCGAGCGLVLWLAVSSTLLPAASVPVRRLLELQAWGLGLGIVLAMTGLGVLLPRPSTASPWWNRSLAALAVVVVGGLLLLAMQRAPQPDPTWRVLLAAVTAAGALTAISGMALVESVQAGLHLPLRLTQALLGGASLLFALFAIGWQGAGLASEPLSPLALLTLMTAALLLASWQGPAGLWPWARWRGRWLALALSTILPVLLAGLLHLQPDWARVIWPLVALSVLAGTLVERRLAR